MDIPQQTATTDNIVHTPQALHAALKAICAKNAALSTFRKHYMQLKKPQARKTPHFETSRSQQHENEADLSSYLDAVNSFAHSIGLQLDAVSFCPYQAPTAAVESADQQGCNMTSGDKRRKRPLLPYKLEISKSLGYSQHNYEHATYVLDLLKAKDSMNMSDSDFTRMHKTLSKHDRDTPTIHYVIKARHELNAVFPLASNAFGYYVSPVQKMCYAIGQYLTRSGSTADTVRLKFGSDGTNITKSNVSILNITFTILDDLEMAKTCTGNYLLGSFLISKENYAQCSASLREVLQLVKECTAITHRNKTLAVRKYFGGDLKNLATLYGLVMANGTYPCVWCTTSKNEFVQDCAPDTRRSITRSLAEAQQCCASGDKTLDGQRGYFYPPLVDFIDFDHVVVDTLHLYLRISERLIKLFVGHLARMDGAGHTTTDLSKRPMYAKFLRALCKRVNITNPYYLSKSSASDKMNYTLRTFNSTELDKFYTHFTGSVDDWPETGDNKDDDDEQTLAKIQMISARLLDEQDDDQEDKDDQDKDDDSHSNVDDEAATRCKRQKTTTTSPDTNCCTVLDMIERVVEGRFGEPSEARNAKQEFVDTFSVPGFEETTARFHDVFAEFFRLYALVKCFNDHQLERIRPVDIGQLAMRLKRWLRMYVSLGAGATVSPYMHIFVSHTCNFLLLHYDINTFNCQGLEKLNQQLRDFYQHATNKHSGNNKAKSQSLKQLVEKQNRFELFHFYGI